MEPLSVELPESLRRRVEDRAAATGFKSASEFVRDLIERDLEQLARLEALALAGVESGPMIEIDDAWWAKKHEELERRFGPAE
jgi:Arc/MetJ-type ribon-helix-helix transcriptional regulator